MKERSLRIDKEGRWFSGEEEITHRRTYLLYARNLTRDDLGRIVLRIGGEECAVEVEDAPFVVKTLEVAATPEEGLKSVILTLNDETHEFLNPKTLRIGAGNVPYCQVREGMFEARFSRGAYQLLVPFIRHDEDEKEGRFFIFFEGQEFDLYPVPISDGGRGNQGET